MAYTAPPAKEMGQMFHLRELRAPRPHLRGRLEMLVSGVIIGLLTAAIVSYGYISIAGWPDMTGIGLPPTLTASAGSKTGEGLAIYEALKVGAVSPRGIDASVIKPQAAIVRADGNLRARAVAGARDTDEGAFWLKRYLTQQIGKSRTLWALTKLGTAYASPTVGAPDYKKAQAMWEAAAALGDPYAACFLGQLHEFGLGVPPNRDLALTWYLRARVSGGCHSLDSAIARLSAQGTTGKANVLN